MTGLLKIDPEAMMILNHHGFRVKPYYLFILKSANYRARLALQFELLMTNIDKGLIELDFFEISSIFDRETRGR